MVFFTFFQGINFFLHECDGVREIDDDYDDVVNESDDADLVNSVAFEVQSDMLNVANVHELEMLAFFFLFSIMIYEISIDVC